MHFLSRILKKLQNFSKQQEYEKMTSSYYFFAVLLYLQQYFFKNLATDIWRVFPKTIFFSTSYKLKHKAQIYTEFWFSVQAQQVAQLFHLTKIFSAVSKNLKIAFNFLFFLQIEQKSYLVNKKYRKLNLFTNFAVNYFM